MCTEVLFGGVVEDVAERLSVMFWSIHFFILICYKILDRPDLKYFHESIRKAG